MPAIVVVSVAVAIPARALVSPIRPAITDAWETVSIKAVAGIAIAVARASESAFSKLVRVIVAESWALIVRAALEIRLFPCIVESLPFGVDAAAAVAPRLNVVVRFRRSVRAAQVRLHAMVSACHEPFIF